MSPTNVQRWYSLMKLSGLKALTAGNDTNKVSLHLWYKWSWQKGLLLNMTCESNELILLVFMLSLETLNILGIMYETSELCARLDSTVIFVVSERGLDEQTMSFIESIHDDFLVFCKNRCIYTTHHRGSGGVAYVKASDADRLSLITIHCPYTHRTIFYTLYTLYIQKDHEYWFNKFL